MRIGERHREPWTPRRLAIIAGVGVVLWIVGLVAPSPSATQSAVCELGGACARVYLDDALGLAAAVGCVLAVVAAALALVRTLRSRRADPSTRAAAE